MLFALTILFSLVLLGMPSSLFGQDYSSTDNYSGDWLSGASWIGGSSPGLNFNQDLNVNVYGEISTSADLFFNKGELIVRDTLVVNGDLGFGSNGDLSVLAGGVLIVLGSLDVGNKVDIAAGGTIIIQGDINFSGTSSQGSFTSDQFPAQVYIGGSITGSPPASSEGGAIPVFDCETAEEHENSNCNYGFIEDIEGEVVEEYYQEVICGGGVDPGVIGSDQNICTGQMTNDLSELSPSSETVFQWFSSVDSSDSKTGTWSLIAGADQLTYSPGSLSQTTFFYRQVQKGNGCTAVSNVVTITVVPTPTPRVFFMINLAYVLNTCVV